MNPFLYPEEQVPAGETGLVYFGNTYLPYRERQQVDHILVNRVKDSSRKIVLWEQLTTKVPNPSLASPWCCYINTVVFYARPKVTNQLGSVYKSGARYSHVPRESRLQEYATHTHKLVTDDILLWQNRLYRVVGGTVVWHGHAWWMRHSGWLLLH
jgi:hypothetical protein